MAKKNKKKTKKTPAVQVRASRALPQGCPASRLINLYRSIKGNQGRDGGVGEREVRRRRNKGLKEKKGRRRQRGERGGEREGNR